MTEIKYAVMASPLGDIALATSEKGLCRLVLPSQLALRPFPASWERDDEVAMQAQIQLAEYFAGSRQHFNVPLDMVGTAFQQTVWQALCEIPFGELRSYGALAQTIEKPKAVRAVGAANGRNPVPIIVPCHRVVGANGKLTGYFGGKGIKSHLLALEGIAIET